MDTREFWEITPKELIIKLEAYKIKMKREEDSNIYNAYLAAYWQRIKRMPNIKDVLNPKKESKPSNEEMLQEVKRINALLGGGVSGS